MEGGVPVQERGSTRKLTTILCADAAGYSRMMREDEEGTYRTLQDCRQQFDRLIGEHEGRIFGSAGDSIVAEFASPVEAVRCAVDIQAAVERLIANLPEERKMRFRIGVNLGDVIVEAQNLIGDSINVAARLQALSEPGELCISGAVFEQIKNKLPLDYKDIGPQAVKNIGEPVRVYRVRSKARDGARPNKARVSRRRTYWLGGAAALLFALIAGAAIRFGLAPLQPAQPSANAKPERISIAVLPFANLSADPTQDYFSDGVTEDIIAALGRFPDLSVMAREAMLQYKGQVLQPGELAHDLGVRYQLEGSVRKDGDRVRVGAQLIDAVSGVQLWSNRYDGRLKDVFAVQDEITRNVAGALAVKLIGLEKERSFAKPTENLGAYDYLLRGRDFDDRNTRPANAEARKLLERAIQLDPNYGAAYVALGWVRLKAATSGWTEFREETIQQAMDLAQKAINLDETDAEAHALLAAVYFNGGRFDLAIGEDDRAIDLNPSDASSYAGRAADLVFLGNSNEAIADFEIATRLNPAIVSIRLTPIGWAYYLEHRYREAVAAFTPALAKSPDDYFVHAGLAAAYAQLGRQEDAARAAAAVKHDWPFFSIDFFVAQFQAEADRSLIAEGLHKAGLK
jgi:adenylate cyclase